MRQPTSPTMLKSEVVPLAERGQACRREPGSFALLCGALEEIARTRKTGCLRVECPGVPAWELFCRGGRLIHATGGPLPRRRWYRLLRSGCAQLSWSRLGQWVDPGVGVWEYRLLCALVRTGAVEGRVASEVLRALLAEVCFEIGLVPGQDLRWHFDPRGGMEGDLTLVSVSQVLEQSALLLEQADGIPLHLLNSAIVLEQPEALRQGLSVLAYENLQALLDGQHTVREVACQLGKPPERLLRSLTAHLKSKTVRLISVSDLCLPTRRLPAEGKPLHSSSSRLIVCVDDSEYVRAMLEGICSGAGYRFVGLGDPLRALGELVRLKPDLLFLDLVMPHVGGHELCSQLRRSALFKDLPIVILTSNDGIVNRLRSKLSGATEFLSKPIESAQQVLSVVEQHLRCQAETPGSRH